MSEHSPGALFTHWIADSLTLWKSPVTDEHLWTAASYYSILANGPSEILYFLAGVAILGGSTILWSLNDLRAGNIMFDGGSICESRVYHLSPKTHLTSHLQSSLACPSSCTCNLSYPVSLSLLLSSNPSSPFRLSQERLPQKSPGLFAKFATLPTHGLKEPIPRALRAATLDLASSNLICSVALTGVLALQAGRFWAESSDNEDDDEYVLVDGTDVDEPTIPSGAASPNPNANLKGRKSRAKTPDISASFPDDKVKPLLQQRVQAS